MHSVIDVSCEGHLPLRGSKPEVTSRRPALTPVPQKLRAGPKADWRLKCLHREEARLLVVESPLAPLATLHGISVLPPSPAGTSQGSHSSLRSEGFLSLPGAGQHPRCHVSSPSSWTSKTQAGGLPGTVGKDPSRDPTQRTKPSGSSRWEV